MNNVLDKQIAYLREFMLEKKRLYNEDMHKSNFTEKQLIQANTTLLEFIEVCCGKESKWTQ